VVRVVRVVAWSGTLGWSCAPVGFVPFPWCYLLASASSASSDNMVRLCR
jgi:hypothetical protein